MNHAEYLSALAGVAITLFLLGVVQQLAVGMFNFLQLVTSERPQPTGADGEEP